MVVLNMNNEELILKSEKELENMKKDGNNNESI